MRDPLNALQFSVNGVCGTDRLVARVALLRDATEVLYCLRDIVRGPTLAMGCARRTGDAFIDQYTAKIIGSGVEHLQRALPAKLDPRRLEIGDDPAHRQPDDRMHQTRLSPGRPRP